MSSWVRLATRSTVDFRSEDLLCNLVLHFYDAKKRFRYVFENGSDGVVFVGMLARIRRALCRTATGRKHVTRILLARDRSIRVFRDVRSAINCRRFRMGCSFPSISP